MHTLGSMVEAALPYLPLFVAGLALGASLVALGSMLARR